jgi:exopolysaccharide production protein ExoQ
MLPGKLTTAQLSPLVMTAQKTGKELGRIYWLPFFILICAPLADFRPMQIVEEPDGSTAVTMRQLAAESDPTMIIIKGTAYILALWLFLKRPDANMRYLARQPAYLLLSFFMLASMAWSLFPVKVFINFGHMLGMGLVLLALARYFQSRPPYLFLFLARILGIYIGLSIPVSLILPGYVDVDGRWIGVTGNANTLGMICVTSVWANVSSLYSLSERRLRRWNWALLALTLGALIGARSATSITNAGVVVIGLWFLQSLEGNRKDVRMLKFGVVGFLALLLLASLLVFAPEVLEAQGFFALFGRSSTLSGRTKLWAEAWELIQMKPWMGWSFDSNMSVLENLGGVGQFHNGYLDLMVRGGWVGLLFFIMLLTGLFKRVRSVAKRNWRLAMQVTMLIVAILLHNITEASIARETHLYWLLIIFAYFFLDILRMDQTNNSILPKNNRFPQAFR